MTDERFFDPDVVVCAARQWIGTPYVHQTSCSGSGCDCLGLIRGVWRQLVGDEPAPLPPYSNRGTVNGKHQLEEAASRYLIKVTRSQRRAGDVQLFRWKVHLPAGHCGIIGQCSQSEVSIIHAYAGHQVCETPLDRWWCQRCCATYRFPRLRRTSRT